MTLIPFGCVGLRAEGHPREIFSGQLDMGLEVKRVFWGWRISLADQHPTRHKTVQTEKRTLVAVHLKVKQRKGNPRKRLTDWKDS